MSSNLPVFVLDSFAIFALLENEKGAARVQSILKIAHSEETQVYLSIINVGEILYITERERGLPLAQKTLEPRSGDDILYWSGTVDCDAWFGAPDGRFNRRRCDRLRRPGMPGRLSVETGTQPRSEMQSQIGCQRT